MNTSQFMDKQIMDLSSSQNKNNADDDFMDLNSHPDHRHDVSGGDDDKKDEILANYDFQPIRPIQPPNFEPSNVGGTRVWTSAESKTNLGTRNYGSLDSVEPSSKAGNGMEKDRTICDAALISEIDRTMKKHADNLMHALEAVSARLSQLETRSRNLENSVDDLRTSVGNNHGNTDGKLRQIENMIREVQSGVQVVKDKQEILETQLQLSHVQISKADQHQSQPTHMESLPQPPPAALQHPVPPTFPNAPPPPTNQQNMGPPPVHQFPQNMMPVSHHDSYYPPPPPPPQTAEPQQPQHHHHLPPPQQLQPPKASPPSPQSQPQPQPQSQYQPPTHMQYSQPPPPMLLQHPSQPPPMSHHLEEPSYLSSQNYPPNIRQPPQQFQGNPSQMYEPPPSGRTGPGFSSQYGPSAGFNEPAYNLGGSQYGSGSGSPLKHQQHGYPQLPTARILPHAAPTGGGGGSSSGSGSGGNRVPIDDVVDKVTNMGFPRDEVRATVRKLTENGQAVDLNVVLDKLMTDGVESQGPRAWFGR